MVTDIVDVLVSVAIPIIPYIIVTALTAASYI